MSVYQLVTILLRRMLTIGGIDSLQGSTTKTGHHICDQQERRTKEINKIFFKRHRYTTSRYDEQMTKDPCPNRKIIAQD